MEKRGLDRRRTQIPITCSKLTADSSAGHASGIMSDCSSGGICIETNKHMHRGNILMIKATGLDEDEPSEKPFSEFRTISIAEVKWSEPANEENDFNFKTGLKYLPI